MADQQAVLRIFSFRLDAADSGIDQTLRGSTLPDLVALPGIVDVLAGRRTGDSGERVVATVWESREAMEATDHELDGMTDGRLEIAPVAFLLRTDGSVEPRILRLFRGVVRPDELDAYIEEARAGTLADADSNPGLVALYLGLTGGSTFITVSAWSDWTAIEDATGGDIRRPMATKNSARLVGRDVTHYEILPNADRPATGLSAIALA